MTVKEQLNEDVKAAMKSGDAFRKDTLRLILAAIKQVEIDQRKTLTDEEVYSLIQTEAKKRRDSITEMRGASRDDLADKEQAELTLIETYLPQQMTREEIEVEVRKAIAESGATSAKEMGSVMKVLIDWQDPAR